MVCVLPFLKVISTGYSKIGLSDSGLASCQALSVDQSSEFSMVIVVPSSITKVIGYISLKQFQSLFSSCHFLQVVGNG